MDRAKRGDYHIRSRSTDPCRYRRVRPNKAEKEQEGRMHRKLRFMRGLLPVLQG
jgi:hypothetical protein